MFPPPSSPAVGETATRVSRTLVRGAKVMLALGAALVGTTLFSLAGCSSSSTAPPTSGGLCRPVAPCPSGWLAYEDTVCSPPDPGGNAHCSSNGDHLCYLSCSTDADCRAMGLDSCGSSITFFHGSDVGTQVAVCDGIAQVPACAAPDGGSGDGG